jgi:hypothetical protein
MLSAAVLDATLEEPEGPWGRPWLVAYHDDERVYLDRLEALFYQLVDATQDEREELRAAGYYLQQPSDQEKAPERVLQYA